MRKKLGWVAGSLLVIGLTVTASAATVAPVQADLNCGLKREFKDVEGVKYSFQIHKCRGEGGDYVFGQVGPSAGGPSRFETIHLDRTDDPSYTKWEGPLGGGGNAAMTFNVPNPNAGMSWWRVCAHAAADKEKYYCMDWN